MRYKGFSEAFDEWKSEADVSQVLVDSYHELLRMAEHDEDVAPAPASDVIPEPPDVGARDPTGPRRSTRRKTRSARRDVAD